MNRIIIKTLDQRFRNVHNPLSKNTDNIYDPRQGVGRRDEL